MLTHQTRYSHNDSLYMMGTLFVFYSAFVRKKGSFYEQKPNKRRVIYQANAFL